MTRVVIVDELLGDQLQDDRLADHCDRCGRLIDGGAGAIATVEFVAIGTAEWYWCDDCADSFTAWRLSTDRPLDGSE